MTTENTSQKPSVPPVPSAPEAGSPGSGALLARTAGMAGILIIILSIVLCLALTVPRFFGVSTYAVQSGSMEPEIPAGALVLAKATDPASLEPGDAVVFYDSGSGVPVTHRVVANVYDNSAIITKGDANETVDPSLTPYENVLGKVSLSIPFLGRILAPIGSLQGKLAMTLIILGAALLCAAGRRARRRN